MPGTTLLTANHASPPFDFMTIGDYHGTMNAVGIAELKARLSHHLRKVRQGQSVTIMDRSQPIATIVPQQRDPAFQARKPIAGGPSLHEIVLPDPLALDVDILDLLLAERQGDR